MECRACQRRLPASASFCPQCGGRVDADRPFRGPAAAAGAVLAGAALLAGFWLVRPPLESALTRGLDGLAEERAPAATASVRTLPSPSVPAAKSSSQTPTAAPSAPPTVAAETNGARQAGYSEATSVIPGTVSYPDVWVPAGSKECQRVGVGRWAAVGTQNASTSCPFAINVRQAYLDAGLDGRAGQLHAYSPTTKLDYVMSCSGDQPAVCVGGKAGRVVIYGGRLRVQG